MLIGHASIDENGKVRGGKAGDSTGKEVCTRQWYNKNWQYVLRCKDRNKANAMAEFVKQICANDNVGYNQDRRNTLEKELIANNWNVSKIGKCECDCSSLMVVAAMSQGIAIKHNGTNAPNTQSMRKAFERTGMFEVLSHSKYLTSDTYLLKGDILLKEGSHTVMALENGRKAIAKEPIKPVDDIAIEVINGKWGTGNNRKVALQNAGYNYSEVQKRVNEILSK